MEDPKYKLFDYVIYKNKFGGYSVGIISRIWTGKISENEKDEGWFYEFIYLEGGVRGAYCSEKEIIKKL